MPLMIKLNRNIMKVDLCLDNGHFITGIIYEKKRNHVLAMKHFRVAWCLDPTYLPAQENMSNFSSFEPMHRFFYEKSECSKSTKKYEIKYDSRHIGHVVEKNQLV